MWSGNHKFYIQFSRLLRLQSFRITLYLEFCFWQGMLIPPRGSCWATKIRFIIYYNMFVHFPEYAPDCTRLINLQLCRNLCLVFKILFCFILRLLLKCWQILYEYMTLLSRPERFRRVIETSLHSRTRKFPLFPFFLPSYIVPLQLYYQIKCKIYMASHYAKTT
jgi:hypothetical protein